MTRPLSPPSAYRRRSKARRLFERLAGAPAAEMFWSWETPLNFGDWLGPMLYEWRTGMRPRYATFRRASGGPMLFTVGSILHHITRPGRAVVWGSGIMFADVEFAPPAAIHAVRGPLTRDRCHALGYDCPAVYGDPGLLAPAMLPGIPREATRRVGIVPHFVSIDEARARIGDAGATDIAFIDVREDPAQVCARIAACETVLSSSLHGLILAHAFARRAVWIEFPESRPKGDGVKFVDHFAAVAPGYRPEAIRISDGASLARAVAASADVPVPDVTGLQKGLLATCPF